MTFFGKTNLDQFGPISGPFGGFAYVKTDFSNFFSEILHLLVEPVVLIPRIASGVKISFSDQFRAQLALKTA